MSTRCVACDFRVGEEHEERAEAHGCPIGGRGLSVEGVVALQDEVEWRKRAQAEAVGKATVERSVAAAKLQRIKEALQSCWFWESSGGDPVVYAAMIAVREVLE